MRRNGVDIFFLIFGFGVSAHLTRNGRYCWLQFVSEFLVNEFVIVLTTGFFSLSSKFEFGVCHFTFHTFCNLIWRLYVGLLDCARDAFFATI